MDITPEFQEVLDAQKAELTKGFEDSTLGLKNKMDELLTEKKAEQAKAEEARKLEEVANHDKALATKDIDSIKTSYQKRVDELTSELGDMRDSNKQSEISSLASDFVTANVVDDPFSRKAMASEYAKRIDWRDGKPVVLDVNGGATINSIEDLQSEFRGAGIYASHIKGTDASGGGATTLVTSGGAATKNTLSGVVEGFDALPKR
jgi:hypothetical protein